MNTALIFAGGSGSRMNSKAKPKQFLELNGKAIIIHTVEYFEKNKDIDNIAIVCIEGWIDYLKDLLKRNFITKVKWIIPGGATGQESIYKGLKSIYNDCENPSDSVVLIHDGVRPLINDKLISDNIAIVKNYSSAITVVPQAETVVSVNEDSVVTNVGERNIQRIARAPQSFILEDIMKAHNQAIKDNMLDMIDSASLMMHYGHTLHIVEGPVENIKITTPFDFYVFRAIFEAKENSQIFGI
jgi:2-C-methyl-D-erythritol 4-phosphate cytidylyltransferase